LVAVDIERPELWPVLTDLSVEAMAQRTWVQKTGGGGYHIIFRGDAKPFRVDGFAEIRAGNCQYIVVAPSMHPETLKPYEWVTDIEKTPIVEISDDDLERLRDKLETLRRFKKFIEAMTDCWRRHHRHSLSLWISGVLYKMGLSFEDAETVLKAIVYLSNDEEAQDRLRALRDTYGKDYSRVKAWSGLKEELKEIVGGEEAEEIIKLLPIRKGLLFEAIPLAQLIGNAKDIDHIANPILPRGCLIVLAGKGGVGKSLLGLHIAYCVSNGKPIFSYYDSKQVKTLIIDNENNPTILRERVELLGLNPLENIDVVSFTGWRLDHRGALAKLKQLVQANGYGLVVMDNWTTLVSTVEENDAVQVSNILTNLRRIAYDTGCTILLIHHLRKSLPYSHSVDEVRGSSVLVNEADLVLLLEKSATPNERIIRTLKNRLGEEFTYRLSLRYDDEGTLHIECEGEVEDAFDSAVLQCANNVKNYLQLARTAKRSELFKAIHYPETTLKRALNYLLSMGVIEKPKRGVYRLRQTLDTVIEEE